MADRIEDGGPAFPHMGQGVVAKWAGMERTGPKYFTGMSLRDWFAGQALGAMNLGIDPDENAEWAYKIADAMLEARK